MRDDKRSRSARAELETEFDETAYLWKTQPREGNEAVLKSLWLKLFKCGFQLYDDGTDRFIDTFENFFKERYDPSKKASHYFNFISARRKHNSEEHFDDIPLLSGESGKDIDPVQEAIDRKTAEEARDPVSEEIDFDATMTQLTAAILSLPERLYGKANNPVKHLYYRMFFTDGIAASIRSPGMPERYARHESNLFKAFCLPFLDFFLSEQCRSVYAIADTNEKLYGEMVPGRKMEEAGHPLPNDVYRTYLREQEGYAVNSDSAVSNQRDAYKAFLRGITC